MADDMTLPERLDAAQTDDEFIAPILDFFGALDRARQAEEESA